jgi:hypothetical protein
MVLYPERECRPCFWGPHLVIGLRDWTSWPRQTLHTAAPRLHCDLSGIFIMAAITLMLLGSRLCPQPPSYLT